MKDIIISQGLEKAQYLDIKYFYYFTFFKRNNTLYVIIKYKIRNDNNLYKISRLSPNNLVDYHIYAKSIVLEEVLHIKAKQCLFIISKYEKLLEIQKELLSKYRCKIQNLQNIKNRLLKEKNY